MKNYISKLLCAIKLKIEQLEEEFDKIAKSSINSNDLIDSKFVNKKVGTYAIFKCTSKEIKTLKAKEKMIEYYKFLYRYFDNEKINSDGCNEDMYSSFRDFLTLSNIFDAGNFNSNDIYKIINCIISRNKGRFSNEDYTDYTNIIFDAMKISESFSVNQLNEEFFLKNKLFNITLSKKYIFIIQKLYSLFSEFNQTYNPNVINSVLECLNGLGLSKKYIGMIQFYMLNKADKKQDCLEKLTFLSFNSNLSDFHIKGCLTDSEYKALKKELNKYYDPYKREIKKDNMTYDDILYAASIMNKMGYDDYQIQSLLLSTIPKLELGNCFSDYSINYEKYKYYFGEEKLQLLNQYINEMFICTPEDYEFWKDEFIKDLDQKRKEISDKYTYELEKIKKKK